MTELDRHWDAIVIGSGLGGLSAAARLSTVGLRVLVLEQHAHPGGYAHHFLRKVRGTKVVYDFDVALHQTGDLKPGRPIHEMLTKLGVLPQLRLRQFDIAYRTRGPRHDVRVPADADSYESLLCDLYPGEARGVRDLFQVLREIDEPGESGGLGASALALMDRSLQEFLDAHVRDERIQSIFSTLWGYVGLVPAEASAFFYARMWASFHFGGCFYIEGGGQALSDAFVRVVESHGGCVALRSEVAQICTTGGRVVGVDTKSRGHFAAPVVVSNAAAPLTFHDLLDDPDLARSDLPRVDDLPHACSIHQAYVGIRGDAAQLGLADRTVFHVQSYDFSDELRALELGDFRNQGWQLGNHNLADPDHIPPNRSIVHASIMADGRIWDGLDDVTYRDQKRALETCLIDRLAEAIPDVRDRIEIVETGTPHTMRRYSWNPQGSIYGYAASPAGHSIHRPGPRTSVPGLYLAGAWTFPGGGFTGAMSSGWHTAGLIFDDRDDGFEKNL